MAQAYRLIYSDLLVLAPSNITLPPLPSTTSQDACMKIKTFFRYARRQITLKNRRESLYYLYHIGEIIDNECMTQRDSKLSKYYYTVSKRLFLIFENNIEQIMRTQNTSTALIGGLKLTDLNELIHWSSFLKGGDI
ncbi:3719_t:CDS:1, partial [Funneliformis geosporum]